MISDIKGFHIEPTNICTLKCSGCARTRFINQWAKHWKNQNLDIDSLMRFLDIDLEDKKIDLCGNYGDPIYHPDFHRLVRSFKDKKAKVFITTNGSYRPEQWWEELCRILDSDDSIIFSIDGLPDNFTIYRENADWDSIKKALDICSKAKVKTVWKYIVFKFNQNDIDRTKELSESLGIDNFRIEYSDRFDDKTEYLIPEEKFIADRKESQNYFKQGNRDIFVNPRCQNKKHHFITAWGHYSPCCHIADHRFYYKTDWGKNRDTYDITKTTLTELIHKPSVVEFYQNITKNPIDACRFNCPATG